MVRYPSGTGPMNPTVFYADNIPQQEGELCGLALRVGSLCPEVSAGVVRELRLEPSFDWSGVTVLRAEDVAVNQLEDEPVLVSREFRHPQQPVLLLACADRAKLARASSAISLEVEPRFESAVGSTVQTAHIQQGNIETALSHARLVHRGRYENARHVQSNAVSRELLAVPNGSRLSFARQFAPTTPATLHAALLARKAGLPVRLLREPSATLATLLPISSCEVRCGATEEGQLLALELSLVLHSGAYALDPEVLNQAVLSAEHGYHWGARKVDGAVQLSAAPAWPTECSPSAFTHWAVERHLDSLAARLGVEPIELKLGNLRPDADGEANIRRTLELSGYANKRALFRDENRARKSRGERKRLGIGASLLSEPLGLVCQVAQIEFDLDTYETTLHELWCGESLTNNDGKPWLFAAGRESSTLSAGIAAAIEYAAGLAIQDLPLSPERLLESQLAL